jgi:hypothetical protein
MKSKKHLLFIAFLILHSNSNSMTVLIEFIKYKLNNFLGSKLIYNVIKSKLETDYQKSQNKETKSILGDIKKLLTLNKAKAMKDYFKKYLTAIQKNNVKGKENIKAMLLFPFKKKPKYYSIKDIIIDLVGPHFINNQLTRIEKEKSL